MAGRIKLSKPLISQGEIKRKVRELAKKISQDYKGKKLLVVGILKGAWIFMADLIRQIKNVDEIQCSFLTAESYVGKETKGKIELKLDLLPNSLEGWHVLLVEDIVDTGLTLAYIKDTLKIRNPISLHICALLDKPSRRKIDLKIDYLGFQIEDKFVVGYGLDYEQKFRNLPYITSIE
jgi:hypoxanthine phosphoribosyltransferase